MTKREYIFKFLDKVQGHRDKESTIRNYLLKNDDEDYVQYLYTEFTKAVDGAIAENNQKKMGQITKQLGTVKEFEKKEQYANQEDLQKLESLINLL